MMMHDLSRYAKKDHIEIQTRYVSFLLAGSIALVGLVFALGVLVGGRQKKVDRCEETDPLAALDKRSGEPTPPAASPVELSFRQTLQTPPAVTEAASVTTRSGAMLQPVREESRLPDEGTPGQSGTYSLQVGSFPDQAEASEMVRRLERAGHKAFLVSVQMPDRGGRWFRVRVGPFASKDEAWRYKLKFEQKERLPAFVVKHAEAG
ncbi:MAG: SPOR domain-containing protein [Deltaproteobacteria bacterium]|nr:SPOR domain-containing protein [Deltaproteobacteria bacterium]